MLSLKRFLTFFVLLGILSSRRSRRQRSEPGRSELLDHYKFALDEYRFQVGLNWSRTQYYLVLNIGILGLATGLLRLENERMGAIVGFGLYLSGIAATVFALIANSVQRNYYREIKRHKKRLEDLLELETLAIRTTPGMGSRIKRLARVDTFNRLMLAMVLALDLTGLLYSVAILWREIQ